MMLEEEVEGTVRAAMASLEKHGEKKVPSNLIPGEDEYIRTYIYARNGIKRKEKLAPAAAHAEARKNLWALMEKGKGVHSNLYIDACGGTYRMYYALEWDKAHGVKRSH